MANSVAAKSAGKAKEGIFKRLSRFLHESYVEVVKKASWPTWDELKKMTAVVILAVIVVAIYIGGVDYLLSTITSPWFDIGVKK
ncbi:MAG: preprotein translocase subunit SecE [Armatimonadota bacterium]|nr:preprotein translocase subunit SecE [Armatimonadota bacterium]